MHHQHEALVRSYRARKSLAPPFFPLPLPLDPPTPSVTSQGDLPTLPALGEACRGPRTAFDPASIGTTLGPAGNTVCPLEGESCEAQEQEQEQDQPVGVGPQ